MAEIFDDFEVLNILHIKESRFYSKLFFIDLLESKNSWL